MDEKLVIVFPFFFLLLGVDVTSVTGVVRIGVMDICASVVRIGL